jgi:17beta-estradiol 17-dehydrogenase / very-long-chain 3-oxoacyl-CoA reductase
MASKLLTSLAGGWAAKTCTAVGAAVLAVAAARALSWTYSNYVANPNLLKRYKKAGKWAVVTGASDGIGLAMALELAKRGFSIVLMARTESKLEAVAAKIAEHKGESLVVPFDFSTAGDAEYAALFKQLDTLEIAMLVNNVGINYAFPLAYEDEGIALELRMLKVNCEPMLRLTKYVVPAMKAKKCGGIINLSSMSSNFPTPYMATYAATKAFNGHFSRSLRLELAPFGVDVLTVTPGFVCSAMSKVRNATFLCPSAKQMAYQTVSKLSVVPETHGHRHHDVVMGGVVEKLPAFILGPYVANGNLALRARALKRQAAKAKEAEQVALNAAAA